MFSNILAYLKAHEPSSDEAIVIIRKAIKFLDPAEIAELKMIVAALDSVVAVVKTVDTTVVVTPLTPVTVVTPDPATK